MGAFEVKCDRCKEKFLWWSGNPKQTSCNKCTCSHKWKRISYGHDKEYFKCIKCGKEDWK